MTCPVSSVRVVGNAEWQVLQNSARVQSVAKVMTLWQPAVKWLDNHHRPQRHSPEPDAANVSTNQESGPGACWRKRPTVKGGTTASLSDIGLRPLRNNREPWKDRKNYPESKRVNESQLQLLWLLIKLIHHQLGPWMKLRKGGKFCRKSWNCHIGLLKFTIWIYFL